MLTTGGFTWEPSKREAIADALAGAVGVAEALGGRVLPRALLVREVATALVELTHAENPPLYVLAPAEPEEARRHAVRLVRPEDHRSECGGVQNTP